MSNACDLKYDNTGGGRGQNVSSISPANVFEYSYHISWA